MVVAVDIMTAPINSQGGAAVLGDMRGMFSTLLRKRVIRLLLELEVAEAFPLVRTLVRVGLQVLVVY